MHLPLFRQQERWSREHWAVIPPVGFSVGAGIALSVWLVRVPITSSLFGALLALGAAAIAFVSLIFFSLLAWRTPADGPRIRGTSLAGWVRRQGWLFWFWFVCHSAG